MRLGVCYMVFDGVELLESAATAIRSGTDHVAATYQTTSYFGNPAGQDLVPTMERLRAVGILDEIIHYEPDLSIHHKQNELRLRNIGLQASRRAGCTHHVSLDVDEFLHAAEVDAAKMAVEAGGHDLSIIGMEVYYSQPSWRITPNQGLESTFIHPVDNDYDMADDPLYRRIEPTRRLRRHLNPLRITPDLAMMHHMSWVRKDIRKKLANSDTGAFLGQDGSGQICTRHDAYRLGERLFVPPDFITRRTVEAGNPFGVPPFS